MNWEPFRAKAVSATQVAAAALVVVVIAKVSKTGMVAAVMVMVVADWWRSPELRENDAGHAVEAAPGQWVQTSSVGFRWRSPGMLAGAALYAGNAGYYC